MVERGFLWMTRDFIHLYHSNTGVLKLCVRNQGQRSNVRFFLCHSFCEKFVSVFSFMLGVVCVCAVSALDFSKLTFPELQTFHSCYPFCIMKTFLETRNAVGTGCSESRAGPAQGLVTKNTNFEIFYCPFLRAETGGQQVWLGDGVYIPFSPLGGPYRVFTCSTSMHGLEPKFRSSSRAS